MMPHKKTKPPADKPKRTKRRKKPRHVAVPRSPDAPHWLPAGNRWNQMPQEIRQAVSRILAPAYRRFVLDAPGELERSIGLTLVHLMWLELCDQAKMAVVGADPNSLDAVLSSPEAMIERHLRLTTVKCQTAELLLKLRVASEMLRSPPATRGAGCQPALAPPADLTSPLPSYVTQNATFLPDAQSDVRQVVNLPCRRPRRWKPRISIRLPALKRLKSVPPAARLMRFLAARDGPQALDATLSQSCIAPNPCGGANDNFVARLMGFAPGWQGLAR